MATSFMHLPVELQLQVLTNISLYSDMKAICLVSKSLCSIGTPQMYYKVDLKMNDANGRFDRIDRAQKDRQLLSKLHSLLLQPANLRFIRVLKTGEFGPKSTALMDELLPLLQKDSLNKISYSTHSRYYFPTPLQMEFLWGSQKQLQDLKLYFHMVPWLMDFLKNCEPSKSAFLKSFTTLYVGGNSGFWSVTDIKCSFPMGGFDLSLLRSLTLNGMNTYGFFPTRHDLLDLFAGHSFANLAKLSLIGIVFEGMLTFTNLPSLNSLVIDHCVDLNHDRCLRLPLEFPNNYKLQSLTYWSSGMVEPLTYLLSQVESLENLTIGIPFPAYIRDQAIANFIRAARLHRSTLRLFKMIVPLRDYKHAENVLKRDAFFAERVQTC